MRLRLVVAVAAIGAMTLVAVVPAQAARRQHIPLSGNAPGSVGCSVRVWVTFSPRMSDAAAPKAMKARGTFFDCTASYPGVAIQGRLGNVRKGGQVEAFTESPVNCPGTPSAGAAFSITWKGTFNGTYLGSSLSGRANFSLTTVGPPTGGAGETEVTNGAGDVGFSLPAQADVAGSFQNPLATPSAEGQLYTSYTQAQMNTMCAAKKGIHKLEFQGSVNLGS
jgi:hypothetical protein